jgi:Penicillin-insensitive murein endopeptidase
MAQRSSFLVRAASSAGLRLIGFPFHPQAEETTPVPRRAGDGAGDGREAQIGELPTAPLSKSYVSTGDINALSAFYGQRGSRGDGRACRWEVKSPSWPEPWPPPFTLARIFLLSTREPDQVESVRTPASSLAIAQLLVAASGAAAQDKGTLHPQPLPPLAHPDDPKTPAKQLFGRKTEPTAGPSHVVGFYASGCLAGAEALPINGPTWQVMRLSRNRNWGHPGPSPTHSFPGKPECQGGQNRHVVGPLAHV